MVTSVELITNIKLSGFVTLKPRTVLPGAENITIKENTKPAVPAMTTVIYFFLFLGFTIRITAKINVKNITPASAKDSENPPATSIKKNAERIVNFLFFETSRVKKRFRKIKGIR